MCCYCHLLIVFCILNDLTDAAVDEFTAMLSSLKTSNNLCVVMNKFDFRSNQPEKQKSFHSILTYLSLQKVYLCGIILQNLSSTCWTHTNITGSRLARLPHVLLLSCDYSGHRLSRALSPCYSSFRKWKQRGCIASKQVNHVIFLLMEIRSRELQLFWSRPS